MYFNNYVYGNIRVDTGEVRTGSNPKTSLIQTDLKGASVKDDNGNMDSYYCLVKDKTYLQFTQQRFAYTGIFKELDEDGNIVMENGVVHDPKSIVFIGEGKDN